MNITHSLSARKLTLLAPFFISLITLNFSPLASATDTPHAAKTKIRLAPTLSISLSSAELLIPDLVANSAKQSNIIDITISTNNSAGYTLNATVGNTAYNTTDLKHRTLSDKFDMLSAATDFTSLDTDNTWGYSTDEGAHYSGLPLYTDAPKTLKTSSANTTDTTKFSIVAKAGHSLPAGTYQNVINLTAVTNYVPNGFAENYAANGKTKVANPNDGQEYYTMQDMNSLICDTTDLESTLKVLDTRDNKVYWIAKLKMDREGNETACWMTQNLALDLNTATTLTSDNTDLPAGTSWTPERNTINFTGTSVPGWPNDNNRPYSASPGDTYYYTSNSTVNDTIYSSLSACTSAGHTEDECKHYSAGNYYNFTSAIAMNDSSAYNTNYQTIPQSICPKGWKLPTSMTGPSTAGDFAKLFYANSITDNLATQFNQDVGYTSNGFTNLRANPLYFSRSGRVGFGSLSDSGHTGYYSSSSVYSSDFRYYLRFGPSDLRPTFYSSRHLGLSIRCVAR